MVDATIGDQLQESVVNASKIIHENASGLTKRDTAFDIAALSNGSTVVLVDTIDKLPPTINNAITLHPTKSYRFTEPFPIPNTIILPAGYVGFIEAEFQQLNGMDCAAPSGEPMFATLNINGIISSIADAGGGAITVTTSAAHGLLDGQFVNITGTTSYNQQRLVISNASGSVFDVQIPFVADESGLFDTGVESLTIDEIDLTNDAFDNPLFDITLADSVSAIFAVDRITAVGFVSPGIIRGGNVVIDFALLPFVFGGLTIENATNLSMREVLMPSLVGVPGATAITVIGAATGRVVIDSNVFELADAGEFPIRIDPTITSAIINISNSLDNMIATDYFDTSAGGLDETDPRVIALNNGTRKDSMFIGGFFHSSNVVGTTVLDGTFSPLNLSTGGGVTAFVENERFNVSNVDEGVLEYTGLGGKTVTLLGVLNMDKSGSTQDYDLRFAVDRGAGFVALPTPLERIQTISSISRDTILNQEVVLEEGDKIRMEIEGMGTTDTIVVLFVSLDMKG